MIALIPARVKLALVQLLIAFVIYAGWRSRRLGRPVIEPQPVELGASELVVAVGDLLQRGRRRDQAASILQGDACRQVAERLGLPTDATAEHVVDAIVARGVRDAAVLVARTPTDEAELVRLARSLEHVRREVVGAS